MKTPVYVLISLVFLILTGMVFGYSYFFYPNKHPIPCIIKAQTGKECSSCGFSKAFSHYVHFEFNEGKETNGRSFPVFLFFLFQFFFRITVLIIHYFRFGDFSQKFIKTDISVSISGFLFAFLPLLIQSF